MTNYGELAAEIDALSEANLRLSEGEVVRVKPSRARRDDVMSIRVSPAELEQIMAAAAARGQRVSDFVREAALSAASERRANGRWLAAPVAEALDQLVERIEEQRRMKPRRARTT